MSGALVLTGTATAGAHIVTHRATASHPTLQYDSRGDTVRALQKRLGVRPTSGWFGPLTRAAVKRFQSAHGLAATGVVDERTWRALDGISTAPAGASQPSSRASKAAAAHRSQPSRASRSDSRATLAEQVLAEAARLQGTPYRYGATGPDAFDCSGFTGYVFRHVGISLPRSSRDQRAALPRISAADARPGDLMFSHDSSGRVFHVAIYAGDGMIWDASRPGETVAKRKIWSQRFSFGRPS
ncbi:MAG: C40 family peptidase [Nocardioidaceae bacterium]